MLGPFLEWSGCVLGLIGAGLLALDISFSRYGWLWFLAANVFTVGMALYYHHYGLLVQQIGFTGTSALGIWRAFGPRRRRVSVYSE